MPHGLSIDTGDHVWLTDVGTHQIYKFSHDGELLLTIGEEGVSGDDPGHFDRPTDVAFGTRGDVVDTHEASDTQVLGHDLAVGHDGAVHVADIRANRIRKYALQR